MNEGRKTGLFYRVSIVCLLTLFSHPLLAGEIRVAVATNFTDVIKQLASNFEAENPHKIKLIFGSTGRHYAQIINGAPFDIFFAADVKRPERLEKEGLIQPGSRFTYALGKLVLWSTKEGYVDEEGNVLKQKKFRYLAIANPKLAPYGKAAKEVLVARGVWAGMRGRIVRGENIGQTFHFVKSGNADLGFVASSQVNRPNYPIKGSYWEVPQSLYSPIKQQAVLLKNSKGARSFLSYVKSEASQQIIREFGYGIP